MAVKRHKFAIMSKQSLVSNHAVTIKEAKSMFILSTKTGAGSIQYFYFPGNLEAVMSRKEQFAFIKKESQLHYNLRATKLGVAHNGADAIAYKLA